VALEWKGASGHRTPFTAARDRRFWLHQWPAAGSSQPATVMYGSVRATGATGNQRLERRPTDDIQKPDSADSLHDLQGIAIRPGTWRGGR
jgi:hypothetical protein